MNTVKAEVYLEATKNLAVQRGWTYEYVDALETGKRSLEALRSINSKLLGLVASEEGTKSTRWCTLTEIQELVEQRIKEVEKDDLEDINSN